MNKTQQVVIIGGGVAGYTAAIRAARIGAQVTLIEKAKLGGTCLNRGCVPTKILLNATGIYFQARESIKLGLVKCPEISPFIPGILEYKTDIVSNLAKGIMALLDRHKISYIIGNATFTNNGAVHIEETGQSFSADRIVLTTGSISDYPKIEGIDLEGVITSDQALELSEAPKTMAVIGGGAIGLELGQIFHRLGTEITILEQMDQILPGEDQKMAGILQSILEQQGLMIHHSANVIAFKKDDENHIDVSFLLDGKERRIKVDKVLLATGRMPFFDGLNLNHIGVKAEKTGIIVDEYLETSASGIFAAGDCIGGMMVAHLAMAEGERAAKNALGEKAPMDRCVIPRCVYTDPEFASVGVTEQEVKDKKDIKIISFPLKANSKSVILNKSQGMIKFIIDSQLDRILGVSILGPSATELIGIATLGLRLDVTPWEIGETVFAHPTLSESFREVAKMAGEGPIHL